MSTDEARVIAAAFDHLARAAPPLQRHSRRMVVWAQQLAQLESTPVDQLGLQCACAFHDLGLVSAGPGPFPARSAALLAGFFAEHQVDPDRTSPWIAAVRGHLRLRPGSEETPEGSLLRRAAWLDALGWGAADARRLRRAAGVSGVDPQVLAPIALGCARDLGRRVSLRRRSRRTTPSSSGPG